MFHYAVSDGEGTLIDYGIVSACELFAGALSRYTDKTVIIEPCGRDCATGK